MKQQILEIISTKPKHFSKIIKNTPVLYEWVKSNTKVVSANLSEMIYSAINQTTNLCSNNNTKKFKSINEGYGFCGTASKCQCASKSVSEKVSSSKLSYSNIQKQLINNKRIQTTLDKYGVTNNAQTNTAKQNRQGYYSTIIRKLVPVKLTPYQRLDKKYRSTANVEFVTPESEYLGVSNQTYYSFKCLTCDTTFSDYIDNGHVPACKTCNPYIPVYTSNQENEVFEFVKSIANCEVQQSDKSIINPYELDIVIPSLRIAIEYCGLYWHSEAHKNDKNYHINKLNLCNKKGYRLITIFEDEWTKKSSIVKNRLQNILGNSTKIFARKCKIKQIIIQQANEFITNYHIQGPAVSKIVYGCFYKDQLVAVMTFGKPRYDKKIEYELIRYCSVGTIVGGASRLFSAFCKDYNPSSVVSYCDMRWGTGNLYSQLTFKNVSNKMLPSYSYTDFVNRYHRSSFTKKKIIKSELDNNKTEYQLMKEKGMHRIWDCGHSKWVWNK